MIYNKKNTLLVYSLLGMLIIVLVQIAIGGITRLTGSGLSITKWQLVTGVLPPLNESQWLAEFGNYQLTPQYQKLNKGMLLADFKFIYFWEWFHRLWGRLGFIALLGLAVYFFVIQKTDTLNKKRFVILLFLYACQGFLGWFMVKSGLVDIPSVSHYRLTAHLLLATTLLGFLVWWVAALLTPENKKVIHTPMYNFNLLLIIICLLQIAFGGFMSGLKAAPHYPSFPDMNGVFIPDNLFFMQPFWKNFGENVATIQFTHRGIAYILTVLILFFCIKGFKIKTDNVLFINTLRFLPILLFTQVGLGITVVLLSIYGIPVGFGVLHQGVGLILLSTLLFSFFQLKKLTT